MKPDAPTATSETELIELLCRHSVLDQVQASRVVREILGYYDESLKAFVQRRHGELQATGLSNTRIFAQLQTELPERRFVAEALTERQIRRIVYG